MNNPPDTDNDEDLLARWSRLKRQEQQPDIVDQSLQSPESSAPSESSPEPQALTDADMPDLDSMGGDSDYAPFLSPQVSDQLRARALRQLFRLPALGVRDGLDDYDDDFTQIPKLGNVVTHEMRRMLAREIGRQENDDNEQKTGSTASDPESTVISEDKDTAQKDA